MKPASYHPRNLSLLLLACLIGVGGDYDLLAQPAPLAASSTFPAGTSLTFSFAQAGSTDWYQGDDSFLALRLATTTRIERRLGPFLLRNSLTTMVGGTYRDDSIPEHEIRVTDNEMFAEVMVTYPLKWKADPYVAANFRTAITESFKYNGSKRTRTASLWDPVISQQSAGASLDWGSGGNTFSSRVGFTLQQIRAGVNTALTDDPGTKDLVETYMPRSGLECLNELVAYGDTAIALNARLGMFGSFDDLSVWNVRFDTEVRFRLWKSIGLTWTINVVHDINQSARTQFRHSLMLGMTGEI